MTNTHDFPRVLRELLSIHNLNPHTLAARTSIPYTTILAWANGDRNPSVEGLLILSDYFNLTVDELLFGVVE